MVQVCTVLYCTSYAVQTQNAYTVYDTVVRMFDDGSRFAFSIHGAVQNLTIANDILSTNPE
jgi:hypothetical protein